VRRFSDGFLGVLLTFAIVGEVADFFVKLFPSVVNQKGYHVLDLVCLSEQARGCIQVEFATGDELSCFAPILSGVWRRWVL